MSIRSRCGPSSRSGAGPEANPLPSALFTLAVLACLAGCTTTAEISQPYLDLREKGLAQMRDRNYSQARSAFRDALSRFPGETFNHDLELLLSDCEYQLGNEAEARRLRERVAKEAISADLKMRANIGLAMMDLRRERYEASAERFRAAAALETVPSERARRLYQAGLALQRGARFAEARESYRKAIEVSPKSDEADRARMQLLYPDHFTVQTGAFARAANAEALRDLLTKKGFPAEAVALDAPRGMLHCVWAGKFKTRAEAAALLDSIVAAKVLPAGAKIAVKP